MVEGVTNGLDWQTKMYIYICRIWRICVNKESDCWNEAVFKIQKTEGRKLSAIYLKVPFPLIFLVVFDSCKALCHGPCTSLLLTNSSCMHSSFQPLFPLQRVEKFIYYYNNKINILALSLVRKKKKKDSTVSVRC